MATPTETAPKTESERKDKEKKDYINSLNQWLWQCYHWQQVNFAITSAMMHSAAQTGVDVNRNVVPQVSETIHQFKVAPIMKRVSAELIDFCILLVVKFIITMIAIEYYDIIDLPNIDLGSLYDFRILQQDLSTYSGALESILEKWPVLFLESVHRLVVIIYETIAIWGFGWRGQTIGKYLMNIRVINCANCDSVAPGVVQVRIPNNVLLGVRITHAAGLRVRVSHGVGLLASILRATMKNCGIMVLFPVSATALFFQHNRAVYDQVCRTLVIEEPPNGPRIVVY